MITENIIISDHSIRRYRQRILTHRQILDDDIPKHEIKKMIFRDLHYRNIKEIVNFGQDYKFVFTKKHEEFRFEKSFDRKSWVLLTVVRYKRMFPHEDYVISEETGDKIYGIKHEIKVRKEQKIEYEEGKRDVK